MAEMTTFKSKSDKFELIREIVESKLTTLKSEPSLSLLDVGCRYCSLKKHVSDLVSYNGVDLFQNAEGTVDFVTSLESGLPISDSSYDFVVALDLLEHLNDFEFGLNELARVSKKYLIIMLPNMGYLSARLEFFLTGSFSRLTDKYNFFYGSANKDVDRHRWLTTIPQMDEYLKRFALENLFDLETIWFSYTGRRLLFVHLAKLLNIPSSLWATASIYILEKR